MKKQLLTACLLLGAVAFHAQTGNEWKNPAVNAVNCADMHTSYFAYESVEATQKGVKEASANFMTLNGTWKFNWVANADQRPTDFYTLNYNDRGWGEMPVPGVWELNGYGDPIYVNVGYAWRSQYKNNPPFVPVENNHVGTYRKEIVVPASWSGKDVIAHFGSVTSNIYLYVNGKYVGYSEDSKLEAEFDITPYIKAGQKNLIAFQVFRWCDGTYLEDQDFFRYSGVGRDCWLYARSKKRIEDIRVTPDLDANYVNGSLTVDLKLKGTGVVNLELLDKAGKQVASATTKGSGKTMLNVEKPALWSAECPTLYTLRASLAGSNEVIPVKVGFRKIELKGDQILVNGKAVLFKGADRHELDPDGGYVLSKERMIQDIKLFKQFNLNAVRTCHYPDDATWYDLCDEYGIYVVAEANVESHGMGYGDETLAKNTSYALAHMQRNQRNVQRNFNHPSIIFWSLGNEAGDGPNFEACYKWIKNEDPSRAVQYEQARQKAHTDIYCPMYLDYAGVEAYGKRTDATKPLIQCEYAHAMGNSEGGFKEYWDLYRKYPNLQGGFIWDFVDQSVRWIGKNGAEIYAYGGDFNRFDASDNNFCDNGLVSPDRVPNPHMYEVGYYYQNIWTTPADLSKGEINIYNENFFRDLSAYYLEWQVLKGGKVVRTGRVNELNVAPQQTAKLTLDLGKYCQCTEWLLNVEYKLKNTEGVLPAGHVVAKNQLTLNAYKTPELAIQNVAKSNVAVVEPSVIDNDETYLIVTGEHFTAEFNRRSGYLTRLALNGQEIIKEGAALTPNFWRAPTDNDFGAGTNKKYAAWKNPQIKLNTLQASKDNGMVVVKATYIMQAVSAQLNLTYVINNEGTIKVTQQMVADKEAKVSNLYRFGMQLVMPKSFENIEYYGRGPVENYIDRKDNTFLGIYNQTVTEQFYNYIRPQENGTKTDIRWWKQTNKAGKGIEIVAEAPFSASALHYTICSLDDGIEKTQSHSQEVAETDLTNLCIDKVQQGLGCVDSWSRLPRPEYMIPYADMEFTFVIKAVSHNIK